MGKQIGLFATVLDEREFIDWLADENVFMLTGTHHPPDAPPVFSRASSGFDRKAVSQLLLCPEQQIAKIQPKTIREPGHPFDGWFVVSPGTSPVIEWTLCVHDGDVLKAGRIWCETVFFRGGDKVKQELEALQSFSKIKRWLRKNFHSTESSAFLAGPDAARRTIESRLKLLHFNDVIHVRR